MTIAFYMITAVLMAVGSIYFALEKQRLPQVFDRRVFVSSRTLFYLYLARASAPQLGTVIVETPIISARRAIVHFILFLLCLYFGFKQRLKSSIKNGNSCKQ